MNYTDQVQKFIEGVWFSHPASAVDSEAVRTCIWRDWIHDLERIKGGRLPTRACYLHLDRAHRRWAKEDQ